MKNFLIILSMILLDVVGCGSRHQDEDDYLNVSPNEVVLENYAGASSSISVSTSLYYWTVKTGVVSDDEEWFKVKVIKDSKGRDGEIVVIAQSPNKNPIDRIGVIKISGGEIELNVVVRQMGK